MQTEIAQLIDAYVEGHKVLDRVDVPLFGDVFDLSLSSFFPIQSATQVDVVSNQASKYLLALPIIRTIDVAPVDRIDQIAYRYYRDVEMWLPLCIYNLVPDPFNLPSKLNIFSLDDFSFMLSLPDSVEVLVRT